MASVELRPRSGTEIVDAAFQLYRRDFVPLVTLTAIMYAPFVILNLLWTGGDPNASLTQPVTAFAIILLGWVFGSLAEASVVVAVSDSYLSGVIEIGQVLKRVFRRFGSVLMAALRKWLAISVIFAVVLGGAGVVMALMIPTAAQAPTTTFAFVGLGVLLLAVLVGGLGAMYFYACYFAVPATVVLENLGSGAGLKRSTALSNGMKRKILTTLGLPMLLVVLISGMMTVLTQSLPIPAALGLVLQQAIAITITPIISLIATLLYYDARIRNEGFDIEVMAAELTAATPGTPAV